MDKRYDGGEMEEEDGDMKVSFYPSLFNKKKKKKKPRKMSSTFFVLQGKVGERGQQKWSYNMIDAA